MGLFSKKRKTTQNNKSKLPFDYIFAIGLCASKLGFILFM